MIQQLTIKTESPKRVRLLVEGAIQNELKTLRHGIQRTREHLAAFEKQFGMTTEEFGRRFDGKDLKETLDYLDWWMELQALHMLEEDYRALTEARLD